MTTKLYWKQFALGLCAALAMAGVEAKQVRLNLETGQELLPVGAAQTTFIKIGLEGLPLPKSGDRPPINVALVLDRSGSMQGDKLRHAKQAAVMALDYLHDDDILTVAAYNHEVGVLVPATRLRDRDTVRRAIDGLTASGNTALFAGVSKGAGELRKFLDREMVNRMVLLSDGLANVGPSSPSELGRLGRELGGERISVSTIGLGLGYNEDLMLRLADASDGNHVFAEQPSELAAVFANEFGELSNVIAQGVTIIIHCDSGVRPLRVLGRDAEIAGNRVTSRINQIYAQQEKYLLLEVEVSPGQADQERGIARVEVRYDDLASKRSDSVEGKVSVRYTGSAKEAEGSVNRDVMVSATEQLATEMDEKALELKDKGDVGGAQAVFREKSQFLEQEAKKYDSDKLRSQSAASKEAEEAVSAPEPVWNRARKELREDQNVIRKQQTYR